MPEHYLVTGATGFVGSELVARLATDAGCIVRAAVRAPASGLPASVEVLPGFEMTPETDWSGAVRGASRVIHLAARVHRVRDSSSDSLPEYLRVNAEATGALARAAAAHGVRRFVFVSSIKANAEFSPPGRVVREDDPPPHDQERRDPYGFSKRLAEVELMEVAQASGMEVTIVRPPLVYGPGVKANFAALIRLVRLGLPLPLASVRNSRSFIGVRNLVDFIVTCTRHPAAANVTFNVSDGEDLSTPELIRRVAALMRRPARLFPAPPKLLAAAAMVIGRKDAALRLLGSLAVDTTRAASLLEWRPPVAFDDELRRTLEPDAATAA